MSETWMAMDVVEAGRKGGLAVLQRRGRGFFSQIGRSGQRAMREKHPDMAAVWGKRGGRPRKPDLEGAGGGENSSKRGGRGPAFQ
ncbi:MAG: hypothetical protein E4G89_07360 [Methanothrix sp.]|nr:MAG: hypothetical protein E4G89_07360 [Methanothrix sp.]